MGLVFVGLLSAVAAAGGGVESGLEVGAPTPSIPVIDVTGPYRGERICYVCEFQNAPSVLAFFRDTGGSTEALIRQLNDLYVRHKGNGLKAVVMIVAGQDARPWLERLHASAKIEIPLTVFRNGPRDVAARVYRLSPDVENTFLVTVNRSVHARVAGIGSDRFDSVARAAVDALATQSR